MKILTDIVSFFMFYVPSGLNDNRQAIYCLCTMINQIPSPVGTIEKKAVLWQIPIPASLFILCLAQKIGNHGFQKQYENVSTLIWVV